MQPETNVNLKYLFKRQIFPVCTNIIKYLPYNDLRNFIVTFDFVYDFCFHEVKLLQNSLIRYIEQKNIGLLSVKLVNEIFSIKHHAYYKIYIWYFTNFLNWRQALSERQDTPLNKPMNNKFWVPEELKEYLILDHYCKTNIYNEIIFKDKRYRLCAFRKIVTNQDDNLFELFSTTKHLLHIAYFYNKEEEYDHFNQGYLRFKTSRLQYTTCPCVIYML